MNYASNCFTTLPWKIPVSAQNFVPESCRFFIVKENSIFIAWRFRTAIIFVLKHTSGNLSVQEPLCSQVISSKESILDVLTIDKYIYFVSHKGLFQVLSSAQGRQPWNVSEHLADCKSFYLASAFELPSLKRVLAVNTLNEEGDSSHQSFFAVIACCQGNGKIDTELYTVLENRTDTECHLKSVIPLLSDCHSQEEQCCSISLTSDQGKTLFPDFKDAKILIVGLQTGQVFCVPFFILKKMCVFKATARLIYQSRWPVIRLACPPDGANILVFLAGGAFISISTYSSESNESDGSYFHYHSLSLPYPLKSLSFFRSDSFLVADFVKTSVVTMVSPSQTSIDTIALKGVSALTTIPGEHFIIAATFHNTFYLIDPSSSLQKKESDSPSSAGCDIDVSLQLVQDMTSQTELLSKVRNELHEEDCIIQALSAVARRTILADHFKMIVKVTRIYEEEKQTCKEENSDKIFKYEVAQDTYQISVEIKNSSSEDFSPSNWKIHLHTRNQDGIGLSKLLPLSRSLNQQYPFSVTIDVPFNPERFSFPVHVDASLVAEIKEEGVESQWTKIHLDTVTLDVSHFFLVSLQPPPNLMQDTHNMTGFLNQLQSQCKKQVIPDRDADEKALMTTYVIPIRERLRQPSVIIERILSNCWHRYKFDLEKEFFNQSDKTVIWLTVLNESVKLVIRKSCLSVSISSVTLHLLHAVKLCVASKLNEDIHYPAGSEISADAIHPKAKNLHAVLETLSLDEAQDGKQLMDIYQDLRNNVSSGIL